MHKAQGCLMLTWLCGYKRTAHTVLVISVQCSGYIFEPARGTSWARSPLALMHEVAESVWILPAGAMHIFRFRAPRTGPRGRRPPAARRIHPAGPDVSTPHTRASRRFPVARRPPMGCSPTHVHIVFGSRCAGTSHRAQHHSPCHSRRWPRSRRRRCILKLKQVVATALASSDASLFKMSLHACCVGPHAIS